MKLVLALKAKAMPRRSRTKPTSVLCRRENKNTNTHKVSLVRKGRMFRLGRRECFHQLSEEPAYSCLCVCHLGFLLVEGVCAQHLSHGFKRGRQRQHELFELVLVLACKQDTHTHTHRSRSNTHESQCFSSKVAGLDRVAVFRFCGMVLFFFFF